MISTRSRGGRAIDSTWCRRAARRSLGLVLILLLTVAVVASAICYAVADRQVRGEAARTATLVARTTVGPSLAAVLAGDPGARARLDAVVSDHLAGAAVSKLVVWTPDGVVLYSTDRRDLGRRALDAGPYRTALAEGVFTRRSRDDLEFGDVVHREEAIEVHVPIRGVVGDPVLELHYDTGDHTRRTVLAAIVPAALVLLSMIVLLAGQVPVAVGLLRRVRGYEGDRARSAEQALAASERERRVIASGMHDSVVQNLAGATYLLASLEHDVTEGRRPAARSALDALEESVRSLRDLLVEIDPAALSVTVLPVAVDTLLDRVRRSGASATSCVRLPEGATDDDAVALYRVIGSAVELVTPVAGSVEVRLRPTGDGVLLHVRGDAAAGVIDEVDLDDDVLRLLTDRVADLDGALDVESTTDAVVIEVRVVLGDREGAAR